jgi:hypothetical protein
MLPQQFIRKREMKVRGIRDLNLNCCRLVDTATTTTILQVSISNIKPSEYIKRRIARRVTE